MAQEVIRSLVIVYLGITGQTIETLKEDECSRWLGRESGDEWLCMLVGVEQQRPTAVSRYIFQIPPPDDCGTSVARVRRHCERCCLGERSRLETEAEPAEIVRRTFLARAAAAQPHRLDERRFIHPSSIVLDGDPGGVARPVGTNVNRGRAGGDRIVNQICDRRGQGVAEGSHARDESRWIRGNLLRARDLSQRPLRGAREAWEPVSPDRREHASIAPQSLRVSRKSALTLRWRSARRSFA